MANCSRPVTNWRHFPSPWMTLPRKSLWRTSLLRETRLPCRIPVWLIWTVATPTTPRPDRSRVSGPRSEECGDLILGPWFEQKLEIKTVVFLIVLDGATANWKAYPCKSTTPSEVISKLHEWMDTFSDDSQGDSRRHGFPSSSWYASGLSNAWCEEISHWTTHSGLWSFL